MVRKISTSSERKHHRQRMLLSARLLSRVTSQVSVLSICIDSQSWEWITLFTKRYKQIALKHTLMWLWWLISDTRYDHIQELHVHVLCPFILNHNNPMTLTLPDRQKMLMSFIWTVLQLFQSVEQKTRAMLAHINILMWHTYYSRGIL